MRRKKLEWVSVSLLSTTSTKASSMQHDLSPSWEDWIDGEEKRAELQGREGERTDSVLELRERKSNLKWMVLGPKSLK